MTPMAGAKSGISGRGPGRSLLHTALKKHRSGGELLAKLGQFDRPGNQTPDLPHRWRVRLTTESKAENVTVTNVTKLSCPFNITIYVAALSNHSGMICVKSTLQTR